jgi:formiminoglutamase
MTHFKQFTETDRDRFLKIRPNETKLGERIGIGSLEGQFVVIGIPESIGVRANRGVGGTETLWEAFLSAFLNIQSTKKFVGDEVSIGGWFDFPNETSIQTIDSEVKNVIAEIKQSDKIPIVIGGGHNNAYPIIAGIAEAQKQSINVINLDAHSDFRAMEGRHSGNGFRYAMHHHFLDKYAIVGLHENYNSQVVIDELEANPKIHFSFYEDIFIRESITFKDAINQAITFTKNKPTGIELDLDCIENVLSSATTPCGISTLDARQYLYLTTKNLQVAYLHIAEGATQLENGATNLLTGKLVAYLVSDFI